MVAAIQEAKLSNKSNLQLKDGFRIIREERERNKGGINRFNSNALPKQYIEQLGTVISGKT